MGKWAEFGADLDSDESMCILQEGKIAQSNCHMLKPNQKQLPACIYHL